MGKKWKNEDLDYRSKIMEKTELKHSNVISVLADYPEILV